VNTNLHGARSSKCVLRTSKFRRWTDGPFGAGLVLTRGFDGG
jgi:hypothetical protein